METRDTNTNETKINECTTHQDRLQVMAYSVRQKEMVTGKVYTQRQYFKLY